MPACYGEEHGMTTILSGAISAGGPLGIIASMITPAFLILSAANLIGSTLTRLARIVDQARAVIDRKRALTAAGDSAGITRSNVRLQRYAVRAAFIQIALATFYSAIGLFVATSLDIAITDATGHKLTYLPAWLSVGGAMLLFIGSMLLLAETTMATSMLRREISDALE
jgi:Protein of unknown function (DUF2721)